MSRGRSFRQEAAVTLGAVQGVPPMVTVTVALFVMWHEFVSARGTSSSRSERR